METLKVTGSRNDSTKVDRGSELGSCRKQSAPITSPGLAGHPSLGTVGKRTCRLARLEHERAVRADITIFSLLRLTMLTYYYYYS